MYKLFYYVNDTQVYYLNRTDSIICQQAEVSEQPQLIEARTTIFTASTAGPRAGDALPVLARAAL